MQKLVLIHGWGMNAGIWAAVCPALSKDFELHLLELPGHGEAPWQSETGLDAWAEYLLDAAPEKAIWLGWSLGGQVALQAALLAPGRIDKLLLCAAAPRFTQAPDWPNAMPVGQLGQFAASLAEDYQGTLERFLALQVRGCEDARSLLRQLRASVASRPVARPEALAEGLHLLRSADLRDLGKLQVPVAWCFGERDQLLPVTVAHDLAPLVPGHEISMLPKAGHAPFLSHPHAWLDWVRQAVNR